MTGMDISAEAIGYAKLAAADAHLDVELVEADMRDRPAKELVRRRRLHGRQLRLPRPRRHPRVRRRAGGRGPAGRRPGHRLQDATAETVLPGYRSEPRTTRTGDITVEATTEYDVAGSRLLSRYHFTRGAAEHKATAIHHVYTSAHLGQLLTEAGFADIQRYSGPGSALRTRRQPVAAHRMSGPTILLRRSSRTPDDAAELIVRQQFGP